MYRKIISWDKLVKGNNGRYECSAISKETKQIVTHTYDLNVLDPKKPTVECEWNILNGTNETNGTNGTNETTVKMNYNEKFHIFCRISGIPPPKITWKRNNKQLPANLLSNDKTELTDHATEETNELEYECFVVNDEGLDTKKFTLQVIGK